MTESKLRRFSCQFFSFWRRNLLLGIVLMIAIYPTYEKLRPTTLADEIFSSPIPDSSDDTLSDRIFEKYLPLGSTVKEATVFLTDQGFTVQQSHLGATPSKITNEMRLTQKPTNLLAIYVRNRIACRDQGMISMDVKNDVVTHVHFYVHTACL